MLTPDYYNKFTCIADKCPDNCCRGWEIDIDEDTLDYYKDLKAYMDAGKVRSTLWNQLPSGASDVLGDDVQGYFAGITDEDQTLDALDEGFKKLAEE